MRIAIRQSSTERIVSRGAAKQAIAAVAILGVLLLTGCGALQNSPKTADDAAIVASVRAKLGEVFRLREDKQETQLERGADKQTISYISVKSVNGVVTLGGEVQSNRAKARAGEIARGVAKVVAVNNNLAVAPGYSDDAADPK
jgi:osmotically-inducible protein OsmY